MRNKISALLIVNCLLFIGIANPVKVSGATDILSIQTLPAYTSASDFMISCTSNAPSVTFSFTRSGDPTYTLATVDLTTGPCQAHVTSAQMTRETTYTFTVSDGTNSISTSTIYDIIGPSPVTGYSKERINNGEYRIHWTNPGNSDFAQVVIYRGDATGFSAEPGHELTRVTGAINEGMSYDDYFAPDPGKTYYYLIRALDKAGNSSGLVGDGGETITITPTPGTGTGSPVTIFPKESATGSVLGTEATPSPTPTATILPDNVVNKINEFATTTPEPFRWILTHKKISIGVLLVLGALGYGIYRFTKKK